MADLVTYLREQGFACSAINTNGYGVSGNLNRNQQELTITFRVTKGHTCRSEWNLQATE